MNEKIINQREKATKDEEDVGAARPDPAVSQKVPLQEGAIIYVTIDAEDKADDDKFNESADDVTVRPSLGSFAPLEGKKWSRPRRP